MRKGGGNFQSSRREARLCRSVMSEAHVTHVVGGFITLDEHIYKTVTGIVLLLAATILALGRGSLPPLPQNRATCTP
jgi:hypothetical protein